VEQFFYLHFLRWLKYIFRTDILYSNWNKNNDKKRTIFFLSRRLAATKKLGTYTILMEYEQSVKWTFGQTVFGQMVFRSNGLSVKCCSVKRWSVKWCFGQMAFGQKNSVKLLFGKVIQNPRTLKFWLPEYFGPTWCSFILRILKYETLRVPLIQISTKQSTNSSEVWLCVASKTKWQKNSELAWFAICGKFARALLAHQIFFEILR
jgi:hypothetical protein